MLIRPVCKKCKVEFRVLSNSAAVIEMASFGPYQVFLADLWRCPGCGVEILGGMPQKAITQHHEEGFDATVAALRRDLDYVVECYETPNVS